MNTCMFSGNMVTDVEIRELDGGNKVGNFRFAVNRKYKDRGGETKEETAWLDMEVWNRTAEILQEYGGKGKKLIIDRCRVKTDQWENDEGEKRSKQVFVVDGFEFAGTKADNETSSKSDVPKEDVPF